MTLEKRAEENLVLHLNEHKIKKAFDARDINQNGRVR